MSRTATIVIVVVVILGLLLCCCLGTAAMFSVRGRADGGGWFSRMGSWIPGTRLAADGFEQELRVDVPATLVVTNEVGSVTVRADDVDAVTVQVQTKARARTTAAAERLLESVDFSAGSSGNRAEISVDLPANLTNASLTVHLDITVPRSTSVEVRNNVGEIQVTGISGTMQVRGDVGEVTVRDVILTGASEVQASVGRVDFQGRLPDFGEVRITSQVGEVKVSLPADSEFRLEASTGVGDIESEFDLQDRQGDDKRGPARELRGRVGADPAVSLVLRAGTGSIDLQRD